MIELPLIRTDKAYKDYRYRWVDNPTKKLVDNFPIRLDIEPIFNSPKLIYMDDVLHELIMAEAKKYGLQSIRYGVRGEPLLHRDLPEYVAMAKRAGVVEVSIDTSGNKLDAGIIQRLIDAKLDQIIVTVPAPLQPLMDNLLLLRKLRHNHLPQIIIQLTSHTHEWDMVADQLNTLIRVDYTNQTVDETIKKPDCPSPYQRLVVLADGDIIPCCYAFNFKTGEKSCVLGNVYKDSIRNIWTDASGDYLKMSHLRSETSNNIGMCMKCPLRRLQI